MPSKKTIAMVTAEITFRAGFAEDGEEMVAIAFRRGKDSNDLIPLYEGLGMIRYLELDFLKRHGQIERT